MASPTPVEPSSQPAPLPNGISTPPPVAGNAANSPVAHTGSSNTLENSSPLQNSAPAISTTDNGSGRRPRDARLLHLVLASLGVTAYQERVPLQLLDFAYRYTAGTLGDALHLSAEGFGSAPGNRGANEGSVNLAALRLAIASRLNYQFHSALPKEFMLELAQEKNRVALPRVEREFGVRLPPERFCLTGTGWALKEEWESDGDDEADGNAAGDAQGDQKMVDAGGEEQSGDLGAMVFEDMMEDEDKEMTDE